MNKPSAQKVTETAVPADLRKAISASATTQNLWSDLTPIARRDFIGWVTSAKLPETRKRRIDRVGSMLSSGKRRPCCYAIVPMNLYKALDASSKAKATWKTLSPDERRDMVAWVESATLSDDREKRIEKVCATLAAGKKKL
jgi:uncharacterized protein YdeI (YjbR/CyaY-like superfamily)